MGLPNTMIKTQRKRRERGNDKIGRQTLKECEKKLGKAL